MKITPLAVNHIIIELNCGASIDVNDGTSVRYGGQLNILLASDGVMTVMRQEHNNVALRIKKQAAGDKAKLEG